jgi:hypothetical protein
MQVMDVFAAAGTLVVVVVVVVGEVDSAVPDMGVVHP